MPTKRPLRRETLWSSDDWEEMCAYELPASFGVDTTLTPKAPDFKKSAASKRQPIVEYRTQHMELLWPDKLTRTFAMGTRLIPVQKEVKPVETSALLLKELKKIVNNTPRTDLEFIRLNDQTFAFRGRYKGKPLTPIEVVWQEDDCVARALPKVLNFMERAIC